MQDTDEVLLLLLIMMMASVQGTTDSSPCILRLNNKTNSLMLYGLLYAGPGHRMIGSLFGAGVSDIGDNKSSGASGLWSRGDDS